MCAVAARAARIDQSVARSGDTDHLVAQRRHEACNFFHGFALGAECPDHVRNVQVIQFARDDRIHEHGGFLACQVALLEQILERVTNHARTLAMLTKLESRRAPSGVKIDSGWNCTPSTGRPFRRTPMTSPSEVYAEISRRSVRPRSSAMREW